jgi:hypothetical protein
LLAGERRQGESGKRKRGELSSSVCSIPLASCSEEMWFS